MDRQLDDGRAGEAGEQGHDQKREEDRQRRDADLHTQGEAGGFVIQRDDVQPRIQTDGDHRLSDRRDPGLFPIHRDAPAVVGRDRKIEQAGLAYVNRALDPGVGNQIGDHGLLGELLIGPVKNFRVEQGRAERHAAVLAALGPVAQADPVALGEAAHAAVVAVGVGPGILLFIIQKEHHVLHAAALGIEAEQPVLGHDKAGLHVVFVVAFALDLEGQTGLIAQLGGADGLHLGQLDALVQILLDAGHLPEKAVELIEGQAGMLGGVIFERVVVHHEAQRQIALVFQQHHVALLGDLPEIAGVDVSPVAVDQIFEPQKQIRKRIGLLIDVAVSGHRGRDAEALQKFGDPRVRGGGEHGNPIVAQQRAVVEGLLHGDLGAPEVDRFRLPAVHTLHNGYDVLLLGGIVGRIGKADLADAVDGAAKGFQQHDQAHAEDVQLLALHAEGIEQQPGHGQRRHAGGGERHAQLARADDAVEQQGHRQDQRHRAPAAQPFELRIGPKRHKNHGKRPQEAETVRQHVRKMGAVPQVVQRAEQEAVGKEQQQQHREDPLPQRDSLAQKIGHGHNHGEKAAEDIRAALHRGRLRQRPGPGQHRAKPLHRDPQPVKERAGLAQTQGQKHFVRSHPGGRDGEIVRKVRRLPVEEAEQLRNRAAVDLLHRLLVGDGRDLDDVHRVGVREFIGGRGGGLQAQEGRHRQQGGHADGDQAEQADPPEAGPEACQIVPVDDVPANKEQHHPNADKQADVVAAIDSQGQADHVEHVAAIPEQAEGSEGYKRKQRHRVEPDGVPVVAHQKGAEGIGRGEKDHRKFIAAKGLFQKKRAEQPRQTQPDQNRKGVPEHHQALRQQRGGQIQRTGQIIGKQRQIARPHAGRPGVEQRIAVLQSGTQIQIKRIVLVPLVVGQDHLRAERGDSADSPDHAHNQHGYEEGRQIQETGCAGPG